MRQKIIKLGHAQFRVFWETYEKQELRLDFRPLLSQLNFKGNMVILHWQGRPWGLRRWGVYCSRSDQYYGVDHDKINLNECPCDTFQIPEKQFKTLPSAVLVFRNCTINAKGEMMEVINGMV